MGEACRAVERTSLSGNSCQVALLAMEIHCNRSHRIAILLDRGFYGYTTVVRCAAVFTWFSNGAGQQSQSAQLESFQRAGNRTRLRQPIDWRLHLDQAGPRHDV